MYIACVHSETFLSLSVFGVEYNSLQLQWNEIYKLNDDKLVCLESSHTLKEHLYHIWVTAKFKSQTESIKTRTSLFKCTEHAT